MTPNPQRLTRKEYYLLGLLCAEHKPDDARELLSPFSEKPFESDHARMVSFFRSFCIIDGSDPCYYQGPIYKGPKSDSRKRFIAAMVRLYLPHLYTSKSNSIRLDRGFIASLAGTLRLTKMCVSKVVREVVVQERAYPEFRLAVDEVTDKLKNQ